MNYVSWFRLHFHGRAHRTACSSSSLGLLWPQLRPENAANWRRWFPSDHHNDCVGCDSRVCEWFPFFFSASFNLYLRHAFHLLRFRLRFVRFTSGYWWKLSTLVRWHGTVSAMPRNDTGLTAEGLLCRHSSALHSYWFCTVIPPLEFHWIVWPEFCESLWCCKPMTRQMPGRVENFDVNFVFEYHLFLANYNYWPCVFSSTGSFWFSVLLYLWF